LAPTRAARAQGLRQAVGLWGGPSGQACADLVDLMLVADAPDCLELHLRQQVKEDGEEKISPENVDGFSKLDDASEASRNLRQRMQQGLASLDREPHQ